MPFQRFSLTHFTIKVHKAPTGCRSISSGTKWFTNPIAAWLAQLLQPIVASYSSIAKDTNEVVHGIQALRNGDQAFSTFDVNQLYPTIPQEACKEAILRCLQEYFTINPISKWGLIVELAGGCISSGFKLCHSSGSQRGICRFT